MAKWILITITAILLTGCDVIRSYDDVLRVRVSAPIAIDAVRIEQGIEVYRTNYCGACHTLKVANTRGNLAPLHDNAAANAAQYILLAGYTGTATTPETYLRESLLEPGIFYTPGYESTAHHMPSFAHLSDEDIDALVYLLLNQ